MNLGSGWFGGGGSGAQALQLDYPRLIASLAASQAASRTAALDVPDRAEPAVSDPVMALVTLFAAQPGWAAAGALLEGSFNPTVAQALAHPGRKLR